MSMPRNVRISGRRTSIRLEPELWAALERICELRGQTVDSACTLAVREKPQAQNVTSAVRSYIVRNLTVRVCQQEACMLAVAVVEQPRRMMLSRG